MIIQVDQKGRSVIEQLCDIALKQGGIGNLDSVNLILRSVILLPTPEDIEQGPPPKSPAKEVPVESILLEVTEEPLKPEVEVKLQKKSIEDKEVESAKE